MSLPHPDILLCNTMGTCVQKCLKSNDLLTIDINACFVSEVIGVGVVRRMFLCRQGKIYDGEGCSRAFYGQRHHDKRMVSVYPCGVEP